MIATSAVSTTWKGEDFNQFQWFSFAFMSSRQLIKCFFPTLSTEPLQAHTPLILEFYYRSQTSLCFDLAAYPALSVPARLPFQVVDTVMVMKLTYNIYAQGWAKLRFQGSVNMRWKIVLSCPLQAGEHNVSSSYSKNLGIVLYTIPVPLIHIQVIK